jgi:RimJ/RimL family protein N-acetyltransferase
MRNHENQFGQAMGFIVPDWTVRQQPPCTDMQGRFCRVVPLDAERHAPQLHAANCEDQTGRMWSYLAYGPFLRFENYLATMLESWLKQDWRIYAIVEANTGWAVGLASYMRIEPEAGSIEVGAIMYSPRLQRTAAGTEAMYLMMKRAFDELGYRRYEWRCNVLNEASVNAAKRLGFQFEGIFRQTHVLKGRNRDTAWFSIIDREWPRIKAALEAWLAPENFDVRGRRREGLTQLRSALP